MAWFSKIRVKRLNDPDADWLEVLFLAYRWWRVVGYCKLKIKDNIGNTDVFVLPEYRRMGIGFRLKAKAIEYAFSHGARQMRAAIFKNNEPSIMNCLKQGYHIIKRYSTKTTLRLHLNKRDWKQTVLRERL